jgi:hypothetical protein
LTIWRTVLNAEAVRYRRGRRLWVVLVLVFAMLGTRGSEGRASAAESKPHPASVANAAQFSAFTDCLVPMDNSFGGGECER